MDPNNSFWSKIASTSHLASIYRSRRNNQEGHASYIKSLDSPVLCQNWGGPPAKIVIDQLLGHFLGHSFMDKNRKLVFDITPKSIIEFHQTHRITAAPARILNGRVQTAAYDLSMQYSICSRK